ncbi:MAG: NADH-quinone oxidoreductase subunit H, partial [Deltaproteobacteria bacterium]
LMIMAQIPFGPDVHTGLAGIWGVIPLQIVRVDTGLLLVFALGSLGLYGAALAGWSSNNRFALLGGLRASAQGVSYEIALGLTAVGILIACGTTELSQLVAQQSGTALGGMLPRWGIFLQPFGAMLFLVAAIAETKRVPFDLPEGESEIIGYFVEYSSMQFGMFMLGEFIEIIVLSALFTTLFLGGWQLPWVLGDHLLNLGFTTVALGPWQYGLAGMAVFGSKVFLLCALQLQIRWTLPRFRYDQLMHLGWKGLLPLALLNIFVTAALVFKDPGLDMLVSFGLVQIALFILVTIAGPRRIAAEPAHAGH